jgi:hypothetical protein
MGKGLILIPRCKTKLVAEMPHGIIFRGKRLCTSMFCSESVWDNPVDNSYTLAVAASWPAKVSGMRRGWRRRSLARTLRT